MQFNKKKSENHHWYQFEAMFDLCFGEVFMGCWVAWEDFSYLRWVYIFCLKSSSYFAYFLFRSAACFLNSFLTFSCFYASLGWVFSALLSKFGKSFLSMHLLAIQSSLFMGQSVWALQSTLSTTSLSSNKTTHSPLTHSSFSVHILGAYWHVPLK